MNFCDKNMLGKGEYGTVKILKLRGKQFALKETELKVYPEDLEVVMACLREEAMNCVHKHIIHRHWSRFWKNKFQLCMELGEPVEQAEGKCILHDIGQALRFMHSKGFIHRDVKPNNIVKVGDVYKLIDFGLTRKERGGKMTGYMITRWFRPPELLCLKDMEHHHYDGRSDMWSLATTAYFLQVGQPLFYGDAEDILRMYKEYKPDGVLKNLICDYEDRWTAEEMLQKNGIKLIDGTMSIINQREGNVGDFVRCLIDGREDLADHYSHEKIYSDL